jgi:hypothetical protein
MAIKSGSHDQISSYPIIYKPQAYGGDLRRSFPELITYQINEVKHEKEHPLGARRILGPHHLLGR